MRLCHSKASFVRAYHRQTQEALLDGHVRAFDFFGGVPRRMAYDNLKTVVISVGKGQDRRLTKHFIELRSHYLFATRFCNVASGNEKGTRRESGQARPADAHDALTRLHTLR
mgnify:CR=1 FL=1